MANQKRGKIVLSCMLRDNTKNELQKFTMRFEIPKQELKKIKYTKYKCNRYRF